MERIGEYSGSLKPEDAGDAVTDYAKRILLASLAGGYGGLESEPARIVRHGVAELGGSAQATILGKGTKANAQFAALANGVAIRYQDYNDVYFGPAWTAHPSDTMAIVFAAQSHARNSSTRRWQKLAEEAYRLAQRFALTLRGLAG